MWHRVARLAVLFLDPVSIDSSTMRRGCSTVCLCIEEGDGRRRVDCPTHVLLIVQKLEEKREIQGGIIASSQCCAVRQGCGKKTKELYILASSLKLRQPQEEDGDQIFGDEIWR